MGDALLLMKQDYMRWLALVFILVLLLPTSSMTEENVESKFIIEEKIVYKEKDYAHEYVKRLNDIYLYVLNPLEKKFGSYYISSLYRPGDRGHHGKMCGVDLDFDLVDGVSNVAAFEFIRDSLPYTQLIQYHRGKHMSHIHIGLVIEDIKKEVLRCYRWNRKRWYKRLN